MKLKWLSYLINICSVLLIGLSLFVLLAVVLTPAGKVPQVMGFSVLRVLTGSMEPTIPENAMLLVQKCDPDTLQAGDIISFFSPDPSLDGALNTHRISQVERTEYGLEFITKGDANLLEDDRHVDENHVLGKVIFISPLLGRVIGLISTPLVFLLIIFLPLVIMLICNLVGALRSAARLSREEEEKAVREALEKIRQQNNNES